MKPIWLVCAAAVWGASAIPARAQGLIHQLPADGTSVRYQIAVTQRTPDGQTSNLAAELRVSSVGTTRTAEGDARWIEISLRSPDSSQLLKLAIPEKYCGKGQDPFAHIVRGWLKRGEGEPEPVEPERARRAVAVFLIPHFENLMGDRAETLDSKIGKLECVIREGKAAAAATSDGATIESTGRFWVSPKAPLGWAQLELRRRTTRDGELERESTSRFTIVEVRDGAVSALPDSR